MTIPFLRTKRKSPLWRDAGEGSFMDPRRTRYFEEEEDDDGDEERMMFIPTGRTCGSDV
jgi:hypothetical protein